MDKNKQIKDLIAKGFTRNQAAMICLSNEHKMQEGGDFNYSKTGDTNINRGDLSKINKSTGIEFTPEMMAYFSTQSTPPIPTQPPVDYSTKPIIDITSDGQFTDRKVWRTQRPEWFVGKKSPIEGMDYTTVPYKQWKTYQTSPEYSTYTNQGQVASMQQGGFTGARLDRPDTSNYINEDIILPQVQGANSSRYEDSLYGAMLTPYGEQLRQQGVEANLDQTDEQKSFSNKMNFQNNYDSLNNLFQDNIPQDNVGLGLYTFGQGLGDKDPWKISTGAGLATLSGARQFMSGLGTGKESARVRQEMQRKQFEDMRKPTMMKEGGHITNAAVMTGRFIVDQPNADTNVELEGGEFVKENQTGNIKKVIGESHENNGVKTTLDDAKVHSNYTEVGVKNAKELSDKYKLSLKKTDTFAKGMDKFNAKLGVNKLVEEQTKLIEMLGDNQAIKSEATKKVNEESLNSKIKGIEDKLNTLKGVQNYVFEDIFARQEEIPKQGDGKTLLDDKGSPMMQEGGHIYNLASKYGISPERAMQLMQEGGQMQSPQEEQASNPQEEQGEVSPEQIIQAFAEVTQQDPNEIIKQLQQLPPEQQQAALQQMMQQLQQTQNPQEEQMEGAPQEEQVEQIMQEGGYTKEQQDSRLNDFYKHVSGLGYTGNKDIGKMQNWMSDNYPQEVVDYFTKNGQPLTAKHVDLIKKNAPWTFENSGISPSKASDDYTNEEKDALKKHYYVGKTGAPEGFTSKENYNKFILEGFKDNKWDWRFPMVSTNLQSQGMTQGALAQISAPNMNKFASTEAAQPQNEVSTEESKASTQGANQNAQAMTLPTMNSDFILPPSAMQAINKAYIPLGRMQGIGTSSSAYTQEIDRQNQTALESLRASGLPPQVVEAIAAGQLATSQGSANEAIGKVNQYNAQSQNQADLFNIGQASKEDLMNTQYAQDYQDKMMATINAYEGNLNRYFIQNNLQNRQNRLDKLALNTMNRENYNIDRSGNISYIAPQQTQGDYQEESSNKKWEDMSAEEQIAERDRRLKNMQLAKNYKISLQS